MIYARYCIVQSFDEEGSFNIFGGGFQLDSQKSKFIHQIFDPSKFTPVKILHYMVLGLNTRVYFIIISSVQILWKLHQNTKIETFKYLFAIINGHKNKPVYSIY